MLNYIWGFSHYFVVIEWKGIRHVFFLSILCIFQKVKALFFSFTLISYQFVKYILFFIWIILFHMGNKISFVWSRSYSIDCCVSFFYSFLPIELIKENGVLNSVRLICLTGSSTQHAWRRKISAAATQIWAGFVVKSWWWFSMDDRV